MQSGEIFTGTMSSTRKENCLMPHTWTTRPSGREVALCRPPVTSVSLEMQCCTAFRRCRRLSAPSWAFFARKQWRWFGLLWKRRGAAGTALDSTEWVGASFRRKRNRGLRASSGSTSATLAVRSAHPAYCSFCQEPKSPVEWKTRKVYRLAWWWRLSLTCSRSAWINWLSTSLSSLKE